MLLIRLVSNGQGLNTEGNSVVKKPYINKLEHLERLQNSKNNSNSFEMGRKVNVFKWPPGTVNTAWLGIAQDKSSRTEIHENTKKKKITGFPHLKCGQLHSVNQI